MKSRIAVFLGGRSPEHDVSVVTGLQALQALDQARFDAFVVYVTAQGDWLVGPGLDDRRPYLPDEQIRGKLSEVTLHIAPGGGWGARRGGPPPPPPLPPRRADSRQAQRSDARHCLGRRRTAGDAQERA